MINTAISPAGAPVAYRANNVAWRGFVATLDNQFKSLYRDLPTLMFTLVQPVLLLLILNSFNFHIRLPNGETRPYIDRLLPGMMAFNGMIVGLNGVIFSLSRYKERGILRRVRATPVPTGSFVAGVILSRLITVLGVTLITYAAGVWLFGATVEGNVLGLVLLAVLGAGVFIPLGLLIVSIARSEDEIPPLFILVVMPSLLFSGAFLDRSGLVNWLHWFTGGLPLTFLSDAVQRVSTLNGGISAVRGDLLGLAVWGVIATVLCSWKFRMA